MIDLSKLPPEGIRLEGSGERYPLEGHDVLRDAAWSLRILPSDQDVFLDVQGTAVWESTCARCLEPLDQELRVASQFLGSKDPELVMRGSHTLGSQDLDVVFLPESILDEHELVKEQFLLHVPMQPVCREGCEGLCPQCGKNWNKGRCQCRPEFSKPPSALAKALAGIKLDLGSEQPKNS